MRFTYRIKLDTGTYDSDFTQTVEMNEAFFDTKECQVVNLYPEYTFEQFEGFGGAVTVMIGMDANGAITGVKVTEHAETPGLGTKAADPGYLEQYKGVTEAPAGHIRDDANIDAVSGATITSNAVYNSVREALAQYQECGGVK